MQVGSEISNLKEVIMPLTILMNIGRQADLKDRRLKIN